MTEKIEEFHRLLQFPEVQEDLKEIIRTTLHESNIFTRLNLIEEHLGADEFHCIGRDLDFESGISDCEEERSLLKPIREQVAEIYTAIDTQETTGEPVIIAGNMTEIRARLLKDVLAIKKPIGNVRSMTSPNVALFLYNDITEEYKAHTKSAASKAAFDVMKKALELYPNELKEGKAKRRGAKVIELIERVDYS